MRLSVCPPHPCSVPDHIPHRKSLSYRKLEEYAREGFIFEVMCLALSPESQFHLRQGTKICMSNNNWEQSLVDTIPSPGKLSLPSIGISADRGAVQGVQMGA